MVIVPESTPAVVVKNLEDGGADAIVFGKVWIPPSYLPRYLYIYSFVGKYHPGTHVNIHLSYPRLSH